MKTSVRTILNALIALGCIAGLLAAGQRYRVEQRNRGVEIALDLAEVQNLAVAAHRPLPAVLASMKAAGATSIGVPEDTFATLEQEGKVHPDRDGIGTTVTVYSSPLLERIEQQLAARGIACAWDHFADHSAEVTGITSFILPTSSADTEDNRRPHSVFFVASPYGPLRSLGVGLDPQVVEAVRAAGLNVVARIGDFPGANTDTMTAVLRSVRQSGASTVVFQGLEVFGYRGKQKDAAESFRRSGLKYGQVEFGKQKGDDALGLALKGDFVRVHSISDGEMATLSPDEAIDRFALAARDRNIRLCYVRMIGFSGTDPVGDNVEYLQQITREIARGHEMSFTQARPFDDLHVPIPLALLIGIGVGAATALLYGRLAGVDDRRLRSASIVLVILCAGSAAVLGETGRKLVALLAALVFPTVACLHPCVTGLIEKGGGRAHAARESLSLALRTYASISGVTFLGVVPVVGLLASKPFLVKANQFMGIKAAHAIPVLLIAVIAVVGLPAAGRAWSEQRGALAARARAFLSEPIRVGALILALLGLTALVLAVARTGNDSGVGASGLEMRFRSILSMLFPARPRTKEFLIGHPALLLALALWFRGRRKWSAPLFVVGVLGQVSLLNTFCHLHTPLRLSVMRGLTGLVLGAVVGIIVYWLVELWTKRASGNAPQSNLT